MLTDDKKFINKLPKQVKVVTRMTTNITWAVWDNLVALGDADGYISFVDCKKKEYLKP